MRCIKVAGVILSFTIATSACAEQSTCLERTIPVGIYTKDGTAAPGLNRANLIGTYQNKPVSVKSVEVEKRLPRVILLLDTSGSMQIQKAATLNVAQGVLSRLPPEMEVGLALFADVIVRVAPPTTDHVKLLAQLEALRRPREYFKGKTALWAAITEGAQMIGTPQVGDVVYLISDGRENGSMSHKTDVEAALGTAGVRLFSFVTLAIGRDPPPSPEDDVGRGLSDLQQIVQATGGAQYGVFSSHFIVPPDLRLDKEGKTTPLGFSVDFQLWLLLNFYHVDIDLPQTVKKPGSWKLDLLGLSKSQRDNLVLTYPRMLFPCG